jgi:hypothetical protein
MRGFYWLSAYLGLLGVSITSLVEFWGKAGFWMKDLLLIGAIAAGVLAILDFLEWRRNLPRCYETPEAVNEYMLKLFRRGGSMSVYANSFAWLNSSGELRHFLVSEAKQGRQVCLIAPHHSEITRNLSAAGVKVLTYESVQHEPEARFTLLNPDEPGSSLLAIGKGSFPRFYIEEFSDSTHSRVLSVARDLLHIIEKLNK